MNQSCDAFIVGLRSMLRAGEQPDGVDGVDQQARLNDADAATGVDAHNALGKFEIGIHLRGGIEEPRAQQERGAVRVVRIAGEVPGKRQSARGFAHAAPLVVIGDFAVLGIVFAIVANIGKAIGL